MVEESIVKIVGIYLKRLHQQYIPISYGVIFGSQVSGNSGQWSDIDLLVVSPSFDENIHRADVNLLWRLAARTDSRIEPMPVGQRQYLVDDTSPILEIARREGQIVHLAE